MSDKNLKKNYLYNTAYQILAIVAPLITTPYVSRTLGVDGVGKYNYAYSIAYIFSLFCLMGTNLYAQREIACHQNSQIERSQIFFEILFIKIMTFLASSFAYMILVLFYKQYTSLLLCAYFYLLANFVDISWLFQGMEDFKSITIRNAVVKVLSIIMVFAFIKCASDLDKYMMILSVSMFLGQLSTWFYIPKYVLKCKTRFNEIVKHIKPCVILFLPSIATYVYTSLDKVMLGLLSTTEEVGFYSQSEKIIKLIMTIVTSLGVVMIPRMASLINEGDMKRAKDNVLSAFRFVFLMSLPMIVGIIVVANDFIPVFLGNGYDKSIFLLQLLSPLILIIGIASVTGQAVLIALNRQMYYMTSVVAGSIANFILNILLIPLSGSVGAALATLVAESIVTVLQIIGVKMVIDIRKSILYFFRYLFASMIMLFVVLSINPAMLNCGNVIRLLVKMVVGCFTYCLVLIVMKDSLIIDIANKIKKG